MALINWATAISGQFNDAADWKGGVVPGASDDASMQATGPAYTVTAANLDLTVSSFQTGANTILALRGNTVFRATNGTGGGANAGTIAIGDFAEFAIGGSLNNTGSIKLNGSGHLTSIFLSANTRLTGGGRITLTDSTENFIGSNAATELINVNNVISGAGNIGTGLVNQTKGVIDATGINQLALDQPGLGSNGAFINAGMLEGTGSGGLLIANAAIDGTGGTIFADAGSSVTLESDTVNGAGGDNMLKTASGGVINIGDPSVANDSSVANVQGTLSNAGTVVVANTGRNNDLSILSAGATLSGGGSVILSGPLSRIYGASSATILTNLDNTISGAGTLGGGTLTLVNQAMGVIDANGATALIINTGANTITNAGTIEATGAGLASITNAVNNTGVLEAASGKLIFKRAVTGAGSALINRGTLDFASSFNENVTFTGTRGVLELAQSQGYSGAVSGFSLSGHTSLDLRDIGFVSSGEATFTGTATSGVLTVTDGTHTAQITLLGNYTGSTFVAKSDGRGGTTVVDPSRAPTSVHPFIAAMASLGASAAALEVAVAVTREGPAMLMAPRTQMA